MAAPRQRQPPPLPWGKAGSAPVAVATGAVATAWLPSTRRCRAADADIIQAREAYTMYVVRPAKLIWLWPLPQTRGRRSGRGSRAVGARLRRIRTRHGPLKRHAARVRKQRKARDGFHTESPLQSRARGRAIEGEGSRY